VRDNKPRWRSQSATLAVYAPQAAVSPLLQACCSSALCALYVLEQATQQKVSKISRYRERINRCSATPSWTACVSRTSVASQWPFRPLLFSAPRTAASPISRIAGKARGNWTGLLWSCFHPTPVSSAIECLRFSLPRSCRRSTKCASRFVLTSQVLIGQALSGYSRERLDEAATIIGLASVVSNACSSRYRNRWKGSTLT
jgi:hypothetical protein